MNNKTKVVIGLVVLGLIALGVATLLPNGDTNNQNQPTQENLTIGAVLPLSGDLAFIGTEIQRGVELAQREAGATPVPVLYEDDQSFNLAAAVSGARKLIDQHGADVLLTAFVEEAKPIVPVTNETDTPLLVVWDSNTYIQEAGENTFSIGFSTEKAGQTMADHAYRELGLRRVAVVSHIDPWSEIISTAFAERFQQQGGQIVFQESVPVDTNDFRTLITKARSTNPDGVYFPLIPPTITDFIVQAHSLGWDVAMMTGDGLIVDAIAAAGVAAEGIYTTNLFTEQEQELTTRYQEAYGTDPIDVTMVSFGYDGYRTILQAAAVDTDLAKGLRDVIGKDRVVDRVERLYQVREGALVQVQ